MIDDPLHHVVILYIVKHKLFKKVEGRDKCVLVVLQPGTWAVTCNVVADGLRGNSAFGSHTTQGSSAAHALPTPCASNSVLARVERCSEFELSQPGFPSYPVCIWGDAPN